MKQLSVFLENKTGRINELAKTLGKAGINMMAFSMAETSDFGILRLIVSDVDKAVEVLRSNSFAVTVTEVVCISCTNVAGALSGVLEQLAKNDIFIEYMYAFSENNSANVVILPNNIEKCVATLKECNCEIKENF